MHAPSFDLLKQETIAMINVAENSFLSFFSSFFPNLPIISIPKAILTKAMEECASISRQTATTSTVY